MGIWSGIKHALNSTLGTHEFKPLDALIQDMWDNSMSVVASDEILKISSKAPIQFEDGDSNLTLIDGVLCNLDGTITVGVDIETNSTSVMDGVAIEKNGVTLSTLDVNKTTGGVRLVTIEVARGDFVTVRKLYQGTGHLIVNYIDFRGTVTLRPSFLVFGEVI